MSESLLFQKYLFVLVFSDFLVFLFCIIDFGMCNVISFINLLDDEFLEMVLQTKQDQKSNSHTCSPVSTVCHTDCKEKNYDTAKYGTNLNLDMMVTPDKNAKDDHIRAKYFNSTCLLSVWTLTSLFGFWE